MHFAAGHRGQSSIGFKLNLLQLWESDYPWTFEEQWHPQLGKPSPKSNQLVYTRQ